MPRDRVPALTDDAVGATRPHDPTWADRPAGFRPLGTTVLISHRDGDAVLLTLRSLTRPAAGGVWRPLLPALLVAQRRYRRRYARALRPAHPTS